MADAPSKRAWRLRDRLKAGKTLTADEQAFMDGYTPKTAGRKPKAERVSVDGPPGAPRDAEASAPDPDSVAPEFQVDGQAPAPDAPRVKPRADKRSSSGGKASPSDWRAKYRPGGAAGGREGTCVEVATAWRKALLKANAAIRANGVRPAFADEFIEDTIYPCMVLTVDRVLPSEFEIGPEIQAAVVTSATTGQLLWSSRKAKQREAASERTRRAQAAYVNPEAAKPEADPAPPEGTKPTNGHGSHALAVRAPVTVRDENVVF